MVELLILSLEVEDFIGHVRQVALFCLCDLVVWDCHCLSHDGMLKAVGAIVAVTALIASLVDDWQYFFSWKLSVLIDAHSGGVDIRNRTIFYLLLVLPIVKATITLLGLDQPLQGLDVGKFLEEQLCLCAFLTLLLFCPDFLKLLCGLMLQSLLFGPEQRLEKSLLIRDDPALVINLLLIIRQPLPSDPLFLLLYLFGDEIPHMQL